MTNLIFFGIGIFTLFCVVADFDWFFDNNKGRVWIAIFGRRGARIAIGIIAMTIMIAGLSGGK